MKTNRNLIFGILFWGICSSCNKAEQEASSPQSLVPDNLIQQLNQAKDSQLDSAIYYANLILDYIRENNLQDSLYIKYNSIKAEQLSKTTDHNKEALQCLVQNYILARNLDDSLTQAKTALALGNYYDLISQYTLALPYIQEAANYYIKNTHQPEAPKLLSNLGEIYLNSGSLYEALESFNVATKIYEFRKDTIQLASSLANIGYTMVQLELFEAAVESTRRGITLLESLTNRKDVGPILGNLSINYRYIYPDSSIYYQKKAIELTKALGDSVNWIASIYNLGNSLRTIGWFDEAEKSYQQVYHFSERNKLEKGLVLSYNALGSLYAKTGKPAEAIPYATLADLALKKTGSPFHIAINLQTLISAHTQLNELQQAEKFQMELDSLNNQMQLLQTQSTVNYIQQAIEAEKSAFNTEMLRQQSKSISLKVRQRNVILILCFLCMSTGAILWFRWRNESNSSQQVIQALLNRYAFALEQKKFQTQSIEDNYFSQLAQQLRHLLKDEKIHLQPNLKTEDVLQYLQISYKDLNQLLKSEFQTTFPQLINQYRVKEAQKLLSINDNSDLSLDKVATLCGFGTKQSFFRIFQAQTGVSPGTFRAYFRAN